MAARMSPKEEAVVSQLVKLTNRLGRFPAKSEMTLLTGSTLLANRVTRLGGSRYFATLVSQELAIAEKCRLCQLVGSNCCICPLFGPNCPRCRPVM